MRWMLAILLGVFLAACQEADSPAVSRVAGGSAVEGETITARLLAADGTALSLARVHATSPDLPDWSLDAWTDSVGSVRIVVPKGARLLVLQVESTSWGGDGPVVFRIPLRPSLDTTLTQERWGALNGRILLDAGWQPVRVAIPGLSQSADVHGGSFVIAHLPRGVGRCRWMRKVWAFPNDSIWARWRCPPVARMSTGSSTWIEARPSAWISRIPPVPWLKRDASKASCSWMRSIHLPTAGLWTAEKARGKGQACGLTSWEPRCGPEA